MLHGGDLALAVDRYGGNEQDWLDLSTGINPHAYPVDLPVTANAWQRLPGENALKHLLGAARKAYRCPDHLNLVAGPGTQSLISLLPGILPGGDVAIASPTYSSHADVWRRAGRTVLEVPHLHTLPPEVRVAVLVNPNNPDGRLVDPKSIREIGRDMEDRGGVLILDEAFADAVPGSSVLPHLENEPVLVLRSFGKFFGLAGLRLGFLAGSSAHVQQMAACLDSWAVSGPALEIGRMALADHDWQDETQRRLADEMADLTLCLSGQALSVFGGTPLFALAGIRNAAGLHDALARRHIWTRVFDYAPTWIRFGLPGSPEAMERLRQALAEAQKEL